MAPFGYVTEAAPGRTLPEGTDFWFSIDNIKRDIKYLNRVEKSKLRWRDRRTLRKFNRKIKV